MRRASSHQSTRLRPVRRRKTSSRVARRTSDDSGRSPRSWTAFAAALAVVGVEQQPIGQHLDPIGEVVDLARHRVVLSDPESQLDDLAGGVLGDQLGRRSLGDDQTLVHDHQAIAQLLGLVHVVGRQAPASRPAA